MGCESSRIKQSHHKEKHQIIFPFNRIGVLQNCKQKKRGTAFLVSPFEALTSAHTCQNGDQKDDLQFYNFESKQKIKIIKFFVAKRYEQEKQKDEWDFAYLILERPIRGEGLYFNLFSNHSFKGFSNKNITVCGYYPENKKSEIFSMDVKSLKGKSDIKKDLIFSQLKTLEGMSGSPIYYRQENSYRLMGIHCSYRDKKAIGCYLTNEKKKMIKQWRVGFFGGLEIPLGEISDKGQNNELYKLRRCNDCLSNLKFYVSISNLELLENYKEDVEKSLSDFKKCYGEQNSDYVRIMVETASIFEIIAGKKINSSENYLLKALEKCESAQNILIQVENKQLQAQVHQTKCLIYYREKIYERAIEEGEKSRQICKSIQENSCCEAEVALMLGKVYEENLQYKQALECYECSAKIKYSQKDHHCIVEYERIADLYLKVPNIQLSKSYYQKCLQEIRRKICHQRREESQCPDLKRVNIKLESLPSNEEKLHRVL